MKKMKFIPTLLCLFSILLITSCAKKDSSPTTKTAVTGSGSSEMQGTWARNDGQATTYLKIDGTVAITCNNGTATTGTFNSSVPSVTFVVSGSTYVFEMSMQGDKLILGVPNNSTNPNHVPTEYIKSSTWPCGSSGKKIAVGLNPNDLPGIQINNVRIENIYIPMQLLNSGVTSPDCSSTTGYIITPATSSYPEGYLIKITYSFDNGMTGIETATDQTTIAKSQLGSDCNKFKVGRNSLNLLGLIPM